MSIENWIKIVLLLNYVANMIIRYLLSIMNSSGPPSIFTFEIWTLFVLPIFNCNAVQCGYFLNNNNRKKKHLKNPKNGTIIDQWPLISKFWEILTFVYHRICLFTLFTHPMWLHWIQMDIRKFIYSSQYIVHWLRS